MQIRLMKTNLLNMKDDTTPAYSTPPATRLPQFPAFAAAGGYTLTNTPPLVSPFQDCVDSLCDLRAPRYSKPDQVNSYVKFRWLKRRPSSSINCCRLVNTLTPPLSYSSLSTACTSGSSSPDIVTTAPSSPIFKMTSSVSPSHRLTAKSWRNTSPGQSTPNLTPIAINSPRMLPPQFGLVAKMDRAERPLWEFYIKNWCPGRSVLERTNLWLQDFAQMHNSNGIQAAIQSLAGIYIYDYRPTACLRRQLNERLSVAEKRIEHLFSDLAILKPQHISELITILILLSMQDIVLVERRLKKPHEPRWVQAFRQCEHLLRLTSPKSQGGQFGHIQCTSLRISQSVMVGRALIIAQTMRELPSPADLHPEREVVRYNWLLQGSNKECLEIHGGCGFSRKLLHIVSQITYCAARLQQDHESQVIPVTAKFLYEELAKMKQWSGELAHWEAVEMGPSVIDYVQILPQNYVIDSPEVMTNITAEAWRVTTIIYLECRVFRLPRNHPEVVANLRDLAACIRIMPTSGSQFTAQAPLFPVFLLGMLATTSYHREIATNWFEDVVRTPVRSSVPPLTKRWHEYGGGLIEK